MYYWSSIDAIKKDWNTYRCNPMYMPLSDNISDDFTYCVQNTQVNLLGYLLQPLTYLTTSMGSIGGQISGDIDGIRGMLSQVRGFITGITENVFSVFLNVVIELQRVSIAIKDIVSKIVGILVTLMYVLDGSNKTIGSLWAGPSGQLVQALSGGHCFHPKTKVEMENCETCFMGSVPLGEKLKDGSIVVAVMHIINDKTQDVLYELPNGVAGMPIYVTGTHLVWCSKNMKLVRVCDHEDAIKIGMCESDHFVCLITDTHRIVLGSQLFFDWADHLVSKSS